MILCLVPSLVLALTLDQARDSGLVGERPDGYISAVSPNPSQEVMALVSQINQQRQATYREISERNQQPLRAVEVLAGKKVRGQLPSGSYYMDERGNWVRVL